MTNKITKENLSQLGMVLRCNKGLNNLSISNKGLEKFNKVDFCNEILNLLDSGKKLQLGSYQREGYFGETRVNIENLLNFSDIEQLQISVYTERVIKNDPSNWTLD